MHTIQPMAKKISRKRMRLNYKHYKRSLRGNGDMLLQSMAVGDQFPTVADIVSSPLDNHINLADNNFGYGGTAEDLIKNCLHPLFLKAKSDISQEDNPNWCEATSQFFLVLIGK